MKVQQDFKVVQKFPYLDIKIFKHSDGDEETGTNNSRGKEPKIEARTSTEW